MLQSFGIEYVPRECTGNMPPLHQAFLAFYGFDYMVFPGFLRYTGGRGGEEGGAERRGEGEDTHDLPAVLGLG